jgi:cobyrinic acid a,c-diamide synthase
VALIDNQFFRATNSALDTNVVLVIDSNGITRGVAPLLMGYQTFDTNVNIVGVILNKVHIRIGITPCSTHAVIQTLIAFNNCDTDDR